MLDDPSQLETRIDGDFEFIDAMKSCGICSIEIIGTPSKKIKISDEGKSLKIIPRTKIDHKDFETCLIMSQPLSLCSGDQSFSEAVSADKFCFYEVYHHKIDFAQYLKWIAVWDLKLKLVEEYLSLSRIFQELTEKQSYHLDYRCISRRS